MVGYFLFEPIGPWLLNVFFMKKSFPQFFEFRPKFVLLWHGPSETEVTDLDAALEVNEEVGRLEISMDNVTGVNELEGAQSIVHDGYYMFLLELHKGYVIHYILHVVLNELHH